MALEGAYAFNDVASDTIVDLSGNGRDIDLTGTNGVQVDSAGLLDGGALGKTGANTISLPAALRTASETNDRTLMFDGLGNRSTWWVRWESTSLDTGVWGVLSLDETAMLTRARDQTNSGPSPGSPVIGNLSTTQRHNFAITYVRSTGVVSVYYDGALITTSTFAAGTPLYTGADDLNMAEWADTGPAIDNLRIFSHALTAGEIDDIAGTPVSSATDVTGTAASALGALVGVATGQRATFGTAQSVLGTANATASGTRTVFGTAATALAALTATATGTVTPPSVAVTSLGRLIGTAAGVRTVRGVAGSTLGRLIATATVPNPLPAARIRISGREPYSHVSGREPRESV